MELFINGIVYQWNCLSMELFINIKITLFQDLAYAEEALNRLQGYPLVSSKRGGIRIEYARNNMTEIVSTQHGWQ